MAWNNLSTGDETLIKKIVEEYMSTGKFDQLRRQLVSDVDTKTAYQNVKQRMQNAIGTFLASQTWKPDLNKNQLRDSLKRHLMVAPFLGPGVTRIVEQSVTEIVMRDVRPHLEAITQNILGIKQESQNTIAECKDEPVNGVEEMEVTSGATSLTAPAHGPEEVVMKEEKVNTFEEVVVPGEEIIELKKSPKSPIEDLVEGHEFIPNEEPMVVEEASCGQPDEETDEESDHSITNQMSPISVGSPSPPSPEPAIPQIKRAADFVGKIPKLKRNNEVKTSDQSDNVESPKKEDNNRKNGVRDERKEEKERRSDKKSERSSDREKSRTSNSKDRSRDKEKDDGDKDKSGVKDKNSHRDKSIDKLKDSSSDKSKSSSHGKDRHKDERSRNHKEKYKREKDKNSGDNLEDRSSKDVENDDEKRRSKDSSREKSRRSDKEKSSKSSSSKSSTRESNSNRTSSRR